MTLNHLPYHLPNLDPSSSYTLTYVYCYDIACTTDGCFGEVALDTVIPFRERGPGTFWAGCQRRFHK